MKNSSEMEWHELPYESWTESDVGSWLKSIGIKEIYITKMIEEEVTGPVLSRIQRKYLSSTIGMKSAQVEHLLQNRDELLKTNQPDTKKNADFKGKRREKEDLVASKHTTQKPQEKAEQEVVPVVSSDESNSEVTFCDYCKFDQNEKDCRYVKHHLLPPETGTEDLIIPCHEYKSLEIAHKLESNRLKAKVANEVLRFACGCMNMRTNGTIHFGIMDKIKGLRKHGEIIGIHLENREDFVDALDYIERCFEDSDRQVEARRCIRNPRFIEVCNKDKENVEKTWVVEYDVVPKASIVKTNLYSVGLPNFHEKEGKVKCEEKVPYYRVGANTPAIPRKELVRFIQGLIEKDQQREEAESLRVESSLDFQENQKRKLSVLLTGGKTKMDNSMFYIVVTSEIQPEHLNSITFLINMKLFCVFDFDPNSEISGLYGKYKEQKPVTPHFLHDYENVKRLENTAFIETLKLFDRVSWIFCNGRNDFPSGEGPVDEKTWIKTRKKKMKKAVTFICNEVLPKSCFVVLFLLTSDVKQPVVDTFHEFYAEMNGHDCLTVIAETKEIYKKWSNLAQVSCAKSTLDEISIVDMPLSHVDATVQSIQLSKNQPARKLPVSNGGLCFLKSVEEAMLDSLEIISVDQCDDANLEVMSNDDIQETELYFYRGGNIDWINFWLADKHKCGAIIERDAYKEANEIMNRVISRTKEISPTESVNIYHNPGSGGSTVARQILWSWRTKVRCAVVKQGKEVTTVCEHMVKLREHEENDENKCLPVLVLLEDQNLDYVDLRRHLTNVTTTKKINPSLLCFILLICNRSNDPEKKRREFPSQTIAVTYKLSDEEKPLFEEKLEYLKQKLGDKESKIQGKTVIPKGKSQLSVSTKTDKNSASKFELRFILTFVLMSNEFQPSYIENVVKNILAKIDHSSQDTCLIRFVALLNTYINDSFISVSHCEAFLGLALCTSEARFYALVDRLSEEAKLIFIHLRESSTHIQSIRIINSMVAKEILTQLSVNLPQSEIAMKLIKDEVLMNHRFGRGEFLKVIKTLFIRRSKRSKGDPKNTIFSPLIEHVTTENGGLQRAVDLMKAAFLALGKDPYVAQQLARLLYTNLRFEEAQQWAEEAKSLSPHDTFVLDTLGQVYKWWFNHLCDTLEEKEPSPERGVEIIDIALKAIAAFRDSEKTQQRETASLNNSYYEEVDVGCKLLKFLSSVTVFSNSNGNSELLNYLLTDYIPAEVKTSWKSFHHQLKGLQNNLNQALERLSLDLSYFQIDISEEEEEFDARDPEQVYKPREWLARKSVVYARFFCCIPEESEEANESNSNKAEPPAEKPSPFQRQMSTYKFGGGNVAAILSLFNGKNAESAGKLEKIMALYPENLTLQELDEKELTNFLFCQIALNCIQPGSIKILPIEKLKDLSKKFRTKGNTMSPASSLFLLSLLFWPEDSSELSSADEKILLSAIDTLQRLCKQKTQQMSQRKSRIATHFFLGKAKGLNKIVHRRVIEKGIKGNLSERKLKWLGGEVWKTKEVVQQLKRIEGWTENENLYMKCGKSDKKIRVIPCYSASLPYGNEKVTFYLGFSFNGVLAYDIKMKE